MLDFNVLVMRLTQGQAPAEMTMLAAPQAESAAGAAPAQGATARAPSAGSQPPASPAADARQIAERVYELMRNDLLILKERRGRW